MTIFTSLKPGDGRIAEIQHAALHNWRRLGAEVITLDGPVPFDRVIARVDADEHCKVAAWCNADILFDDGFLDVVAWCEAQSEDFLVVGRRTDLLEGGQRELHRPSGMDYFFFRRGMFRDLPPTVMGRSYCDSALLAHCLRRNILVVDATDVMTVTHQWHDYGHVPGGRDEVFGGEAAQANRRNNRLRDFGPHVGDVRKKVKRVEKGERAGRIGVLKVVSRRVPLLRRFGMWGLWNLVTHGGIGFWGIHEYLGEKGARFLTRSRIIQNYKHSNVVWKFNHLNDWDPGIYTGFDLPCMLRGWREKRRTGKPWTVFLWDPPALEHRDWSSLFRKAIDFCWRQIASHCDRLVLNIHPGLLVEMGIGKLENVEYRMQDAFDGMQLPSQSPPGPYAYDFGVLSSWTEAKGGPLLAKALQKLPGSTCLWIGSTPPRSSQFSHPAQLTFPGHLPQEQAFAELRKCRVLVAPYLPVPSLKWNYVLKLFEYLQIGAPIVASDNPGNVAIAEKYPGRITLFRSGDLEDLVQKLGAVRMSSGNPTTSSRSPSAA